METKSLIEVISFVASITSLILAVGAIWLSIVFYRMSSEAAKATTEAAKGIAASVERLEKLFDKLYSDTFSMMKDTVQDMRKHIWPTDQKEQESVLEEVEKKADEKITKLKTNMESQLMDVLRKQKIADNQMTTFRNEISGLLEKTMSSSRMIESEAREETIREHILVALKRRPSHRPIIVGELIERMAGNFPITRILSELERLSMEGIIESDSREIIPNSSIRLIK